MKVETIRDYLKAGKKLIPLNSDRIPIHKGWKEKEYSTEYLETYKGNVGWAIGPGDLVIDIDPRNGGTESWKKLKEEYEIDITPHVLTPRGGQHIYTKFKYNKDLGFNKSLKKYPGIDFLTEGKYCVIPGSNSEHGGTYTWYDNDFDMFDQVQTPDDILGLVSYQIVNSKDFDDIDEDDYISTEDFAGSTMSEEKVKGMLDKLDHNMHNDDWVKVGHALFNWDPVRGLELWEEWSKGGHTYKEGETARRWATFKNRIGGVTLGSLVYMAKEVDYDEENVRVNEWITKIFKSNEKEIDFNIIPKLAKERFDYANRERICSALKHRWKALTQVNIAIGIWRSRISKQEFKESDTIDNIERPEWCKNWTFINNNDAFMNMKHMITHSSKSFDIENGKYVPSITGTKPSATKFVSDRGFVDKVQGLVYLPNNKNKFLEREGLRYINTFDRNSLPIPAEEYTDKGLEVIDRFKKHLLLLLNDQKSVDIMINWLAHQVQHPGVKLYWAPVIQSIEGMGKKLFEVILKGCLGDRNVGVANPTQVISQFNDWMLDKSVVCLEELRLAGHSRYEAANAMKPIITDDWIGVNPKNIKAYNTINIVNLLICTNFKDCIPLDENDRRFWIIFCLIKNMEELRMILGMDPEIYFSRLFDDVRANVSEIHKWLMEHKIDQSFKNLRRAPMTEFKKLMIMAEQNLIDGMLEVKDMIKRGGEYWNEDVICIADLFEAVQIEYPDLIFNTSTKNQIMKKLGYFKFDIIIRIHDKSKRVYTKGSMKSDEIRTKLLEHYELFHVGDDL